MLKKLNKNQNIIIYFDIILTVPPSLESIISEAVRNFPGN